MGSGNRQNSQREDAKRRTRNAKRLRFASPLLEDAVDLTLNLFTCQCAVVILEQQFVVIGKPVPDVSLYG